MLLFCWSVRFEIIAATVCMRMAMLVDVFIGCVHCIVSVVYCNRSLYIDFALKAYYYTVGTCVFS